MQQMSEGTAVIQTAGEQLKQGTFICLFVSATEGEIKSEHLFYAFAQLY